MFTLGCCRCCLFVVLLALLLFTISVCLFVCHCAAVNGLIAATITRRTRIIASTLRFFVAGVRCASVHQSANGKRRKKSWNKAAVGKAKIRIKTCCKWWQNDAREEKKLLNIKKKKTLRCKIAFSKCQKNANNTAQ